MSPEAGPGLWNIVPLYDTQMQRWINARGAASCALLVSGGPLFFKVYGAQVVAVT